MATNVRVFCRFRPPSKGEKDAGATVVSQVDPDGLQVNISDGSTNSGGVYAQTKFNFDRVFGYESTQAEVFQYTAQPLVKEVFQGYNITLFAYGQTGSGKTHTMMGNTKVEEYKGIIPRLVESIFNGIDEADAGIEFTVKLSYVEIYNEKVRDLLVPRSSSGAGDNLKIREYPHGGVYIEGVTETYVNSFEQVYLLMQQGQDNRAIASTNMNDQSSRSHSVFIMTLGQLDSNTGSKRGAKLTLVDLAGSEKVGKTGAAGQTLVEAQAINKSLSALGNVINALTSQGAHIPYRDSKLTRLLSDSLGGNSKTALVVTGSPMSTNMEETLSTLRFGTRAKMIKNKATINQEKSVAEYKMLLQQANLKIGIQGNIIEVLEKDVANLMECLNAIDPEHLKIPIPALMSRDVNLLEKMNKGEFAKNVDGEEGNTTLVASPTNHTNNLPPMSTTPTPTPTNAQPSTSPPPAANNHLQANANPAAAGLSVPITSPTNSHPSPQASPISAPIVKYATPARGKPAAGSDDDSPPTSPDTSPDSSPVAKPAVAPAVAALPTLDALSKPTATAAAPSATSASATFNATAQRKPPGPTPHSLAELMLANSDLKQQLTELRTQYTSLNHNMSDAKQELVEAQETWQQEKAKLQQLIQDEKTLREAVEEKAEKSTEIVDEFEQLRKKVDYMKKEHLLEQSQYENTKQEYIEEIETLKSKVKSMEAKIQLQGKAYENVLEKHMDGSTAAPTTASAHPQKQRTPSDKLRSTIDEHPLMGGGHSSNISRSSSMLLDDSASASAHSRAASFTLEEQSQIETLNRGLKRKCDQYIQLMMQHQAQGERVDSLEVALEDSNQRLKEHMAASTRKIKELDEKLLAAENLCAKFLESGRYWRQERNAKNTKQQGNNKIVMPLHGGGGKKPTTYSAHLASLPNSPAPSSSSHSSLTSPSPAPRDSATSTPTHQSRPSFGARIGSSIRDTLGASSSSKPKGDSMASFF